MKRWGTISDIDGGSHGMATGGDTAGLEEAREADCFVLGVLLSGEECCAR